MKERTEWLHQMRKEAEALYDHISPQYWVTFGLYENETHREYLQKFLDRIPPHSTLLSAACGAGRYDGILLEAGHSVVGIDQSAGMLARAQERFLQVRYEKIGLQEMDFHEVFEGAICMDAMEHICPEDYPGILRGFQEALKPGGVLYFTADRAEEFDFDLEVYYERAKALGLPVVFGEVTDEAAYEWAMEQPEVSGDQADPAVYHYYPPLEKVREWIDQAGLAIEEEGAGSGLHHFVVRKRQEM
jgi:2-polyprenyl-3-methyl-5-hydroxy-6-metoxy-1,4-benzoquinol methylase